MSRCSLCLLTELPLVAARRTTAPDRNEHWRCGTKFLISVCDEPKKCHHHLQPSEWRRLAFSNSAIFLCLRLGEGGSILSTWAVIASWPMWSFHFFTGVSPVDVIGVESGLVRYFFLSAIFTTPINNTGSGLIYSVMCFLELSLSALYVVATFAVCALLMHISY
jgi:hypothetical protein